MEESFPHLRSVVLDAIDARGLAEFYRQLLGYHYRPGDDPRPDGNDADGSEFLMLVDGAAGTRLAFQQVPDLARATWPDGPVPQQLHIDFSVADVQQLAEQHARAMALGAQLLRDDSDDAEEPIYVYADPQGHPFCIFVAASP